MISENSRKPWYRATTCVRPFCDGLLFPASRALPRSYVRCRQDLCTPVCTKIGRGWAEFDAPKRKNKILHGSKRKRVLHWDWHRSGKIKPSNGVHAAEEVRSTIIVHRFVSSTSFA